MAGKLVSRPLLFIIASAVQQFLSIFCDRAEAFIASQRQIFQMMTKSTIYIFLILFLIIQSCANSGRNTKDTGVSEPFGTENMAYKWGKISLECTANDTENFKPRPTITSRVLALVWVSIFDAWSRYDAKATPLFLSEVARRPAVEHTLRNKEIAISYAAYRTMLTYYFSDSILLRKKMIEFGLDPDDTSENPATAVGIGNLAARMVIEKRRKDGANQMGDMANSQGVVYGDYTGYIPANSPDEMKDVAKWQPKYFSDGKGGKFAPGCLTPHWGKVIPI